MPLLISSITQLKSTMPVDLPPDVFVLIVGFLDLREVYTLRLVSRDFRDLTKSRALWNSLIRKYVLKQCLPIPRLYSRALDQLSALELEQCLRRALKLRRNWVSPMPAVINRFTLPAIVQKQRIVSMHLVPGHERALLLSLSMQTQPTRKFTLRCWDIEAQPPVCLASYECDQFRGLAVNKETSNGVHVVAVLDPHLHILSINQQSSEGQDGRFIVSAAFPNERNTIQMFSGSTLICRENNGTMQLWKIDSPDSRTLLQSPHQGSLVLDIIITKEYILMLRSTHLEFYALVNQSQINEPSAPTPIPTSPGPLTLHPLFVYQWQWRIDNAGMTIRRPVPGSNWRTPVSILLRYGSYFPWAINILHHYDLLPNHDYIPTPTTEGNLPYDFPPVLRETIGSPVRLHATSDMAIGEYGTAIWTDSHTEDFYGHADRGQRVAGCFSRRHPRSSGSVKVEGLRETEAAGARDESDDESDGLSDQVASAMATSVYVHQDEDSWVRIALDETEGRIFLGRDDGCIEVVEYI